MYTHVYICVYMCMQIYRYVLILGPQAALVIKTLRGMPPTLLGLRSQLDFDSFQNAINALCIDYSFTFSFEGRSRFEAEQGWRHVAKPFNVEVAKRPNMISTH